MVLMVVIKQKGEVVDEFVARVASWLGISIEEATGLTRVELAARAMAKTFPGGKPREVVETMGEVVETSEKVA